MPLTHVCVWDSEIGYRRVTVDEANELYPYEVPSSRGHFVCELCAQNVGFSKARVDTGGRCFFHSSAAQNKDCEDRQIQLSSEPPFPVRNRLQMKRRQLLQHRSSA